MSFIVFKLFTSGFSKIDKMTAELAQKTPAYAKAMLMGLIIECPFGGNPKDCRLYERRKLPMEEKIEWMKSLSGDELLKMYQVHCECLRKKEKNHM